MKVGYIVMNIKYLIYIGLNNSPLNLTETKRLIVESLSDCTISECIGYYNQQSEHSLRIEKYTDKNIDKTIQFLCRQLKQDCILVEKQTVNSYLITAEKQA